MFDANDEFLSITTSFLQDLFSEAFRGLGNFISVEVIVISDSLEEKKINLAPFQSQFILLKTDLSFSSSSVPNQRQLDDVLFSVFTRREAEFVALLQRSNDFILSSTRKVKFSIGTTKSPNIPPTRPPSNIKTFQPTRDKDKNRPIRTSRSRSSDDYDDFFIEDKRKSRDFHASL